MNYFLSTPNPYAWMVRLAIALGLFLTVGFSIFMFVNKDIAPFWDMVWVIYFLLGGLGKTPPDWFSSDIFDFRDNEHQPYLPMIIWGFDFEYFDSNGLLPQVLMQMFAILTAIIVTGWSKLRSTPRSITSQAITLCACALMLSPLHFENLVYPKQIHVYTSVLFAVLSLSVGVSIPKGSGPQQVKRALLSSFLAFCATFSFGYGLVVWPALLIHGLLARWPWPGYLTILGSSAGTVGVYFSKYTVLANHSDPTESIFVPMKLINYASLHLAGSLIGAGIGIPLGHAMGYIMLAAFAFASFRVYVQRDLIDEQQLRSLLICLFCIGVALLTALARITVNTGFDSRYRIISTLFILAIPGLFQLRPPIHSVGRKWVLIAFLCSTLGLSVSSYVFNIDALRWRQFTIREGAIGAAFNTTPLKLGLYPGTFFINDYVWPYFLKHHGHSPPLNIFSLLGRTFPPATLNDHSLPSEQQCLGHVDLFLNREGNTEFDIPRGWARLGPKGERNAPWVIITNTSGVTVGLATTGVQRLDVGTFLKAGWIDNLVTDANHAGFIGLVKSLPGDELDFFAYKDGESCRFARKVKAPDA